MDKPLVSIVCITFNQEQYIAQCLDGFLMQKTDFQYEILIHDDASTDKTADIIRIYEKKNPGIFKPIYQTTNQYSQGINPGHILFSLAQGKYIAVCEGDDYWTDPLKLQKQVDFLEANEDCSLCFHASQHVDTRNLEKFHIHRPKEIPINSKFEMKHAILGGGGFMATNSMVFLTKYALERPDWMDRTPVGDLPLMLLLASKGKIGYVDGVMSTYRMMSSSGSWSASMQHRVRAKKHHYAILKMWTDFDDWTNGKYHKDVLRKKMINKKGYLKSNIMFVLKRIISI